jgi:hypothetical protein
MLLFSNNMLQAVVVDKEKFSSLRKSAHKLAGKFQAKERMQICRFPNSALVSISKTLTIIIIIPHSRMTWNADRQRRENKNTRPMLALKAEKKEGRKEGKTCKRA